MNASVQDLVAKLETIVSKHGNPRGIVERVIPLAREMADDIGWVTPVCYEASEDQGFGVTILHEHGDHTLLVETVSWLPGRGVAPHDHQTWGVVIGLDGSETNVTWKRLDDGSQPGYAELAIEEERSIAHGDTVILMPDDIHSVRNEGDRTSLSLHIYGRSLAHVERSEFDPIAKTQRRCPQRQRTAV